MPITRAQGFSLIMKLFGRFPGLKSAWLSGGESSTRKRKEAAEILPLWKISQTRGRYWEKPWTKAARAGIIDMPGNVTRYLGATVDIQGRRGELLGFGAHHENGLPEDEGHNWQAYLCVN